MHLHIAPPNAWVATDSINAISRNWHRSHVCSSTEPRFESRSQVEMRQEQMENTLIHLFVHSFR